MDDPKKRQTKAITEVEEPEDLAAQVAALQETVKALIAQKSGGMDDDKLETILTRVAQISADAAERAANPSNKTHPGISVFSYPEGDRKRPRPELKCPMFWVGYPIGLDTTTAEELELFNQAEPGVYTFLRTDGKTPEKLTVVADRDAGGNISRMLFTFQTKENKETLPSMASMLRQAFKIQTPEQIELEKLRKEVESLRAVHA